MLNTIHTRFFFQKPVKITKNSFIFKNQILKCNLNVIPRLDYFEINWGNLSKITKDSFNSNN